MRRSFDALRAKIERAEADLLLLYSTQWVSVIGHQVQADPARRWVHVDFNWHELGELPYEPRMDPEFGAAYVEEARALGLEARTVAHHEFPIDTGTIVALRRLNSGNRLPASVVSCNMYAEKKESVLLGQAAARALARQKKRAVAMAVAVTALSARFHVTDIDPPPGPDQLAQE